MIRILVGDCKEHMAAMEPDSIDSIVTDPPYGLEFMGKGWDRLWTERPEKIRRRADPTTEHYPHDKPAPVYRGGITAQSWHEAWAREAWRVLKPGGYLLAFGGTRTFHRLTVAIEDAGFEIRDCLMWLYGSGFPKSHSVSKAMDKAAGAEREVVGPNRFDGVNGRANLNTYGVASRPDETAPATDLARQWDGWGTALKPAWEPIIMARKPLIGSVAANVTQYGTGGINVDGCRIEAEPELAKNWERNQSQAAKEGRNAMNGGLDTIDLRQYTPSGRWPANVLLDDEAAAMLDVQSGESKSTGGLTRNFKSSPSPIYGEFGEKLRANAGGLGDTGGASRFFKTVNDDKERGKRPGGFVNTGAGKGDAVPNGPTYGDSGAVSRFFYTAKASRAERNKGLDGMPAKPLRDSGNEFGKMSMWNGENGDDAWKAKNPNTPSANHHPTVKPLDLMQWLVRLVTPPGGTVLDPFMGSGSTLVAADREGFNGIGIELDAEYAEIARRRIMGDCPLFAEVAD